METVLDQAKQRNAAKRKLAVQPCAFAATLAVRPTLLKVAEDALNLLQSARPRAVKTDILSANGAPTSIGALSVWH